jgi:Bacterial SH3 domain
MDSAIEKLELGLQRMAKAGDDPDLLGLALQSIHGALEDTFRARLAADPHMPSEQREAVLDPKRVQWKDLLDAMQLYGDLSAHDRELIWRANGQRTRVAHGGRYGGTRAELARYASLAQQLCGYTVPAKPLKVPAESPAKTLRPAGEKSTPRVGTSTEAPNIPRAVRAHMPTPMPRTRIGWWSIVLAVALLVGLASFVVLRSAARPLAQLAAAPANPSTLAEATATAPTANPPTPATPRAATVNAPDGLNIRRDHSSRAAILGALPHGTHVAVLGGPVDADGRTWWQIAANDQQGWCAGEYLIFE